MRKLFTLFFIFTISISFAQDNYQQFEGEYKFLDETEYIIPEIDYNHLLIIFDHNADADAIAGFDSKYSNLNYNSNEDYPWENHRQYFLDLKGNEAEGLLSLIRKEPSVLSAYPAFVRDGDIAFLDNLFLLNMNIKDASNSRVQSMIQAFDGEITEEINLISSITYVVSVPADVNIFSVCLEIGNMKDVIYAQPNFYHTGETGFIPNDPLFSDQWWLSQASDADIDATEAWDITKGSSSIAVAVIDGNGYDLNHAEMAGKYISPYNAVDDNNDPSASHVDENHGTPCAGLIGALTNNSLGVASIGYNTMVVPIKMGFNFNGGNFSTSEVILIRACEWVMTSPHEIVAVSNSYTMGSWANITAIRSAFANMRTDSRGGLGSVVLAATGNENTYNSEGYPAYFPHVLGVGATNRFDARSSFSNYGDSTDIAAPGTDTWTIDRTGAPGYSFNDYYEFSGTSAACPIAAGVVALIASVNPSFTWDQLQQRLCTTCDKVGGYSYQNTPGHPYDTWNLQTGYGRVNAYEAVQGSASLDPPTNLQAGVTGSDVHLSWDAPGGGSGTEEELIYDNNTATGAYKYPGFSMSTHMSPDESCQILKLKFYTTSEGGDNEFYAKVFNWAGSQPGTDVLYQSTQEAINEDWKVVDVSGANLNMTGDFVVGFGSFTEEGFLGYDENLNNGRSWDLNESSQQWSDWNEAYLIRAVVLYPNGKLVEIGGDIPVTLSGGENSPKTSEKNNTGAVSPIPNQFYRLLGLIGYKVYRNGSALNTSPISTTYYDDNGLAAGTYNYLVSAVYDEGESNPAGPVEVNVSGIPLDPPTDLQASVNGSDVNLSWTAPGGGGEQWIYYHDGTFETSFASTDGGAGIAQLFTLTSTPASMSELRFYSSDYQNWDQALTIYVLSGDGTSILGGPYTTNGVENDWISIPVSVNLTQATFMIATYNDDPGGPYVGCDDSYYDATLYFGNHTGGFTELGELGDYEYVGSQEARIQYADKSGRLVSEWIRPGSSANKTGIDIHHEKEPLSASYPDAVKALLGYNIYRDGTKVNSSIWTSTSFTQQDVPNGTYNYGVSAVYDEGESSQAGPVQVTVAPTGLDAPSNLTAYISGLNQVALNWTGPGGGSQEELLYDNDESTGAYNYPSFTMSTHMSPSGPCQVLTLKYFTSIDAGDNTFNARVFNWAGSQPGQNMLFDQTVTAVEGWMEVDVSGENLTVDGDFVVGFGSLNETTFLAFDGNLDNGRSWDYDETGGSWSSWNEAYIIRAVVQYGDGTKAELGVNGLLGYNIYRNNVKVNSSLVTSTNSTDMIPTWGTFVYNVTAVYDEGESAFSNSATVEYYFGIDEPISLDANVYPNPAWGVVFINSAQELESVQLISLDGRQLLSIEKKASEFRLDVSKFNQGLYLLKLRSEDGFGVYKLLLR